MVVDGAKKPARRRAGNAVRRRWCLLAVVVVLLVAGGGVVRHLLREGSPESAPPGSMPIVGAASGFNVLLVSLDTVRQDRLGCYGYSLAHTPVIDALAARGARFDDAVASTPVTLPSHTTIMTGLYPPHHAVRDNGLYRLAEEHETLAERLKNNGYDTAAFVGCFVLDERFGLDQGFDVTSGEDESTAEYKSVNIVLKAMDPGRRKDDITCLIRFKLLISASDPEGFDVFIRWSGIGDIKTDPTDIRTDTNIGKIIKALYQLTISSEEVLIATKKAAAEFKIEKNIAVIKNLYQELNSLCQTIQEERDKWMAFRKDEYFYWICQEHEEWDTNKGHRYESMSDILKSLDVISSVK